MSSFDSEDFSILSPALVTDTAADARPSIRDSRGRYPSSSSMSRSCQTHANIEHLPNEILFQICDNLDVNDLLSTSRTNHHLRSISLTPLLHLQRLRRTRDILPPLLFYRPSIDSLIARSIFLTETSIISRRLARSLVSIRLSRRLAARPSPEALVQRAVLPGECVPGTQGGVQVAPALVARKKAVERERVKDGLRRWIEGKWSGQRREKEESVRKWEESKGIGKVWKLRKFWERVGKGEICVT